MIGLEDHWVESTVFLDPALSAWIFDVLPSLRETKYPLDALTAENSNLEGDEEGSTSADAVEMMFLLHVSK